MKELHPVKHENQKEIDGLVDKLSKVSNQGGAVIDMD